MWITWLFLALAVILVGVIFYTVGRRATLPLWKTVIIMMAGALFGIAGIKLMYLLETGEYGGMSFYGAHFLGPVGIILGCYFLKTSKPEMKSMLDISAVALCAALVLLKIHCRICGCCHGIALETDANGNVIRRFPSQTSEAIFALLLMILFIRMIRKGKNPGSIYPLYMILYGGGRYILNLFRETTPWILNMPSGNFWSILSVIIGAAYLYIRYLLANAQEEKNRTRAKRTGHKVRR